MSVSLFELVQSLPETSKKVVSVLSGGLDSSITTMILVKKYGADNVCALSFNYGQKQRKELEKASDLSHLLGIDHRILNLGILGEIARPYSANISGTDVAMPTIKDVLGDPAPKTYVPNRNMIMYSIAAAHAEVIGAEYIFCGLQVHDQYGYHDTTQSWVDKMNSVLAENRKNKIKILAPFSELSKYDEILLAKEMRQEDLLVNTLTCYNPDEDGRSCGACPSCAERINAFAQAGLVDPVSYSIKIPWDKILNRD